MLWHTPNVKECNMLYWIGWLIIFLEQEWILVKFYSLHLSSQFGTLWEGYSRFFGPRFQYILSGMLLDVLISSKLKKHLPFTSYILDPTKQKHVRRLSKSVFWLIYTANSTHTHLPLCSRFFWHGRLSVSLECIYSIWSFLIW